MKKKNRVCKNCGEDRPSKFYKKRRDAVCHSCLKKRRNEQYKERTRSICTKRAFLTHILKSIKYRARKKEIYFKLSIDDVMNILEQQGGRCALTGYELTYQFTDKPSPYNMSIDRLDNSGGYTVDNVQIVTTCINYARHEMSVQEFIDLCERVVSFNSTKTRV